VPRHLSALTAAVLLACGAVQAMVSAQEDAVAVLLHRLEGAIQEGGAPAFDALLSAGSDPARVAAFKAAWQSPAITRVVVRERDRTPRGDQSVVLVLEVLIEYGQTARMLTWRTTAVSQGEEWLFESLEMITSVDGLHRLQLDSTRQFRAHDLRVLAEDFELTLADGDVFLCRVPSGVTGLVLVGRGEMTFRPQPETEQHQIELLTGRRELRTAIRAAFVRIHPSDYGTRLAPESLTEVDVVPATRAAAEQVFRVESAKSFAVDLGELSRDAWSLLPPHGDFLAEVRTNRFGTLTYVHTGDEPENISLFDRARHRNISIYASRGRLASRGPFYNEDDETTYDVQDYNVDVTVAPERFWFDGRSSIRLRARNDNVSTVSLRLNASLSVRSVSAPEHGRLLFLRVRNQNALVVNLPTVLHGGSEITLTVAYSGRLEPQAPESEASLGQSPFLLGELEPGLVYSNRSYWHPQSSVTDYATATVRMTLPPEYGAVCSGVPAAGSPVTLRQPTERRIFLFRSTRPVRYLGCAISRFTHREGTSLDVPRLGAETPAAVQEVQLPLDVHTTSRLRGRAKDLLTHAADIVSFYAALMEEVPYARLSLAVIESPTPGGHSPPYLAAYQQTLPGTSQTWTTDPTSFADYPEFFLAHEIAHQWWGHGVGWQNYHEQWLSEGFSQYFAALYAERQRGPGVFASIIRQMNRWAVRSSPQGPVYLGYRLGHVKGDPRVVRALIYNKGAMVLHMLRRLVGDDAFFRSLRRFYRTHLFEKAGTDDVRRAFELETGRDLARFFDRWIYGWTLPALAHASRVEQTAKGSVLILQLSQRGELFDFPVTVTLRFRNGGNREVVLPVTDRTVEYRVPLEGALRGIDVNADRAALLVE
jgi:hypothetical protein